MSETQTARASVLHGAKELRVVRPPPILSAFHHQKEDPTTNTSTPGRAHSPASGTNRHPRLGQINRPLRLRPALLFPLPQRRHSRLRTTHSRPRVRGYRHSRRPRRHPPPTRRRRGPRSRPPLQRVQAMPFRAVQYLPLNALPLQCQICAPCAGNAPGYHLASGPFGAQAARGPVARDGRAC